MDKLRSANAQATKRSARCLMVEQRYNIATSTTTDDVSRLVIDSIDCK